MSSKSTTLAPFDGPPLLSVEAAAERLGTTRALLISAVSAGLIPAFKARSMVVFKTGDVEAFASTGFDWGNLAVAGLPSDALTAHGLRSAFYDQKLYSFLDLARFFKISVHEARTVLVRYSGDVGVTRDDLWALIVAGAGSSKEALADLDHRLQMGRNRRAGRPGYKIRDAALERDQSRCRYCGRLTTSRTRQLDHVIPRSRGGKNVITNIVVACQPCNTIKGTKLPHEAGMRILRTGTKPSRSVRITNFMPPIPAPESYDELVMK